MYVFYIFCAGCARAMVLHCVYFKPDALLRYVISISLVFFLTRHSIAPFSKYVQIKRFLINFGIDNM